MIWHLRRTVDADLPNNPPTTHVIWGWATVVIVRYSQCQSSHDSSKPFNLSECNSYITRAPSHHRTHKNPSIKEITILPCLRADLHDVDGHRNLHDTRPRNSTKLGFSLRGRDYRRVLRFRQRSLSSPQHLGTASSSWHNQQSWKGETKPDVCCQHFVRHMIFSNYDHGNNSQHAFENRHPKMSSIGFRHERLWGHLQLCVESRWSSCFTLFTRSIMIKIDLLPLASELLSAALLFEDWCMTKDKPEPGFYWNAIVV